MQKKSLMLVSVFLIAIFLFSGIVYANTAEDIKNGINNAGGAVVDGVQRLGNDVRNGIGSVENGIEDALKIDNHTSNANDNTRNDGYTATRTTGDATNGGTGLTNNNNPTMWIWLIVAVAGIVIVGVVWYYATQNNTTTTHRDE